MKAQKWHRPSTGEWSARKEAFTRELEEKKRAELLESYVAGRVKEARVKKNPDAIK